MSDIGVVRGFSSKAGILAGNARAAETERRFSSLIDGIKAGMDEGPGNDAASGSAPTVPTKELHDPRLPGDYISSLIPLEQPRNAAASPATGAAANSGQAGVVDRTSKLYEQALELESYFVKIMLSSMRNTVQKGGLTGDTGFASNMYEDMLYDEFSRTVTRGAGFGLADQVYLQLSATSLE